jgi:hypothetical protein
MGRYSRGRGVLVSFALLGALGCRSKAPEPDRSAVPGPSAVAAVSASAGALARPGPSASAAAVGDGRAPTYRLERFVPTRGGEPGGLYQIEGALLVTQGLAVSRIVGDALEPIGKVPDGEMERGLGHHTINHLHGQWPEWVGATYQNEQGRAAEPSYIAVKGQGNPHIMGVGGGLGRLYGLATAGDTSWLGVQSSNGELYLSSARGPKAVRKLKGAVEAGCKPSEVKTSYMGAVLPAVAMDEVAATPAGTLMALGTLCGRGPGAEVWGKDGASRVVPIEAVPKEFSLWADPVAGAGDELWVLARNYVKVGEAYEADNRLVHYKDGAFAVVEVPTARIVSLARSPQGQLILTDGETIHRRDGDRWVLIGRLDWSIKTLSLFVDEQGAMWARSGGVQRLREGKSLDLGADCATPFVYLYDASGDNPANFSYPSTRKALASFAGASALGFVEFEAGGRKRVGVKVTSPDQATALIEHLRKAMKNEKPRAMCFEPSAPRSIALK